MSDEKSDRYLSEWAVRAQMAEEMVPMIGTLYRDRGVIITVFGHSLVGKSATEIIQLHRVGSAIVDLEIGIHDSYPILKIIAGLDLSPARIDLGNLVTHLRTEEAIHDPAPLVERELSEVCVGRMARRPEPQDIVLYGFGRIGRLIARILVGKTGGVTPFAFGQSSCDRVATMTWPSAPVCFDGIRSMDPCQARSIWILKKTPSL